jgi:hypothetical protein
VVGGRDRPRQAVVPYPVGDTGRHEHRGQAARLHHDVDRRMEGVREVVERAEHPMLDLLHPRVRAIVVHAASTARPSAVPSTAGRPSQRDDPRLEVIE